ncbi:MAG: ABC transporter ATP-binding protein [Phycisphaerae bacterium]|jgi:putative ABC transport system ATP-binding protein
MDEPSAVGANEASPRAVSPVLTVCDLSKTYLSDGQPVDALRGVSFDVHEGEFVAIMGASGSGKSTLLHLIGGLDVPSMGSICVGGQDLHDMSDRERTLFRRRRLGIVFQAYNLLPTLSAVENVALPALLENGEAEQMDARAGRLLEEVNLSHRAKHRPQALSGGEQQRVAIARALMNDPVLLLADEPTGNLDSKHGAAIWGLLSSLARDGGRTVVAVTHEADAASHADRVLVLRDGGLAGEIGPGGDHDAAFVASRYRELVG